jgi:hypothetical protein
MSMDAQTQELFDREQWSMGYEDADVSLLQTTSIPGGATMFVYDVTIGSGRDRAQQTQRRLAVYKADGNPLCSHILDVATKR